MNRPRDPRMQRPYAGLRSRTSFALAVLLCLPLAWFGRPAFAVDFVKPTAEELSMTSLKGYPGAPAVILYREEITRDDMHSVQHYERIKILTEEGKKYANVELGFLSTTSSNYNVGDNKVLEPGWDNHPVHRQALPEGPGEV